MTINEKDKAVTERIEAPVRRNDCIAPDHFIIKVEADFISRNAIPGQFVMVRPHAGLDPLLRRPFSIHDVENGIVSILYKVVGKGTRILSSLKKGDCLDLLGPLGRGFHVSQREGRAIVIAGGIGIAPLFFLTRRITHNHSDARLIVYYGAKCAPELVLREVFEGPGFELHLTTEDGSVGRKGLVTDLLKQDLPRLPHVPVYACGPQPMLRALARLPFGKDRIVEFSLESNMACGLGACLGCALKTGQGYAHVCKDGPVFSLEQLSW